MEIFLPTTVSKGTSYFHGETLVLVVYKTEETKISDFPTQKFLRWTHDQQIRYKQSENYINLSSVNV